MIDPKFSLDDQFWAQWIDAQGRNPEAWLDTAAALKRAADTLAPIYQGEMQAAFLYASSEALESPSSLGPVYMMLAGFAFENLAKGIIVSKVPNAAPPSRHLDEQLIAQAGVDLDDGEPELVRRLGLFLTSLGRYPVPLPKDAGKLAHGSIMTAPMRYSTNDPNLVNPLYERMQAMLEARITAAAVST